MYNLLFPLILIVSTVSALQPLTTQSRLIKKTHGIKMFSPIYEPSQMAKDPKEELSGWDRLQEALKESWSMHYTWL